MNGMATHWTVPLSALAGAVLLFAEPPLTLAGQPLIIGHRGASGYRPEHTLASYELAIDQGADYVEPDVVATRDGVLICRHDCEIGSTTDVAAKFPRRRKTITLDGRPQTGFFVQDFTLEEIKTLRARQRSPLRSHKYDGQFAIPTLEELLQLVARQNRERARPLGILPELKHSRHHRALGLPLEEPLLALLGRYGYREAEDPCMIQSFEPESLQPLSQKTSLRLLQLLPKQGRGDAAPFSARQLREIARYATAIGAHKESILPRSALNRLEKPSELLPQARAAGLQVFVYTFRNEPFALAEDYAGDPAAEVRRFARLGVDGLFTDFPDTAVQALRAKKPGGTP